MSDSHTETPSLSEQGWPRGLTVFERRFGNGTTRIVVALIAIPIVLGTIWFGGIPFTLLVAIISTGALLEFYWLAEFSGARPSKGTGVIVGLAVLLAFAEGFPGHFLSSLQTSGATPLVYRNTSLLFVVLVLAVGTMATFVAGMYRSESRPMRDNAVTVAGVAYVSLSLGMLLGLRSMFGGDVVWVDYLHSVAPAIDVSRVGAFTVIAMMIAIWTCDSLAYFTGRAFGRHHLFTRISPKKTWEGGVGGGVGAIVAMIGMKFWLLPYLSLVDAILLGLFAALGGQIGDLVESHFKRDVGAKDSSHIIPGHGGLLDRFDSLLFVAPLWYLYHSVAVV